MTLMILSIRGLSARNSQRVSARSIGLQRRMSFCAEIRVKKPRDDTICTRARRKDEGRDFVDDIETDVS